MVIFMTVIGASFGLFDPLMNPTKEVSRTIKQNLSEAPNALNPNLDSPKNELNIEALTVDKPNDDQVKELIQAWLKGKSKILSGGNSEELSIVARPVLIKRVKLERSKDLARKESQIINATITKFKVVSQTPKRIEVKVQLAYSDQRIKSSGKTVSETSIPSLKVTYVLGREKKLWQLVAYLSGS